MSESGKSGFDEREKGYERKFQQDQELAFKVRTRRDKHFALWAAERLGLSGEAAERHASTLVEPFVTHATDDGLVAAVEKDFAGKGLAIDHAAIRHALEGFAVEARQHFGVGE